MKYAITVLLMVLSIAGQQTAQTPLTEDVAQKAYEMRMAGNASGARTLLEKALSKNPDNAPGQYELARTLIYIGTGEMTQLEETIAKALAAIRKARKLDPENPAYALVAGRIVFFQAYMALHGREPDAKKKLAKACKVFEEVLALKSDFHEVMLYLVEIYGVLPEAMGGDKVKAEEYAEKLEKLEKLDPVFGAKARIILRRDKENHVDYWKKFLAEHKDHPDALIELGRAYLFDEKAEEGARLFEIVVKIDPGRSWLLLDLGRYHVMTAMSGEEKGDAALSRAEKVLRKYLDTKPIVPLHAFTLGLLARIRRGLKDNEGYKTLTEQARKLDPHYSKAMGTPSLLMFVPPGEIPRHHRYLFRPL